MKRRTFLQGVGAISGGLLAGRTPAESAQAQAVTPALPAKGSPGYWPAVRAQFTLPAGFAYLNTAGLASSPLPVTSVVKAWMDREEANPAPGHSEADWARIRAACASLLGPSCHGDEIALLSTATEAINAALNAIPLAAGDEVITSTHEHPALVIPLLHKMKTHGVVIRTFEPDLDAAQGNIDRIAALVTPRTRLIFISHVTCTTGQVMPVAAIGQLAASRGITFALDGAQSWVHFPFDVASSGAHYFAASGHKWLLGPKRTGILWVRRDRIAESTPTVVGAYSESSSSLADRSLVLRPTAQRFEYGTQNDALIYGIEAAAQLIQEIGLEAVWAHNQGLAEQLVAGLVWIPGLRMLSPRNARDRSAIITFAINGRDNRQVTAELVRRRLRVRSVTEAGLDAVRASFHVCNDGDEVERLVAALRELTGTAGPKGQV
jgi:selenocysteine lyase/cysteine desulfurase